MLASGAPHNQSTFKQHYRMFTMVNSRSRLSPNCYYGVTELPLLVWLLTVLVHILDMSTSLMAVLWQLAVRCLRGALCSSTLHVSESTHLPAQVLPHPVRVAGTVTGQGHSGT